MLTFSMTRQQWQTVRKDIDLQGMGAIRELLRITT
jgi:hypothetical protein